MPNFSRVINQAYNEILDRPADPGGLAYYQEAVSQGQTETQLRENLLRSDEYAAKNPIAPPPIKLSPLKVDGNRFVDSAGDEVKLLGAIHCCDAPDTPFDDAKVHWWPLVDEPTLDKFAAHGLNWTHIRLGPFTVAGECDPNYVGYLTMPDAWRVDIQQWFIHFWGRARTVCHWCLDRGIYVEADLVDRWVRQRPGIDPWHAQNNIQGIEAGGLEIFEAAPQPIHERWIRKCVEELGEFPNVMFNTGNEGFKRYSPEWELGVRSLVRFELRAQGYGDRLVGSNTHNTDIEAQFDYATRHANVAQDPESYPLMVTEYGTLPPDKVLRQVRSARETGTAFHYWMGSQTTAERETTLNGLKRIVGG